jgi:PPOX class probable F420-dependent enzyme
MTQDELNKFLTLPHIAKLATTNPDGSPQISPVWFYREGNSILVSTYKEALKVRNVRRNPTVSLLIDSANGGLKLKGILMRGRATLIEGAECDRIVKQIYDKYLPPKITRKNKPAATFKRSVTAGSESNICIKVTPSTISTWNYSKMTVNDVLAESAQAYVSSKASTILQ